MSILMMCKLVNQQSAPEIDTDVFGGNPVGFHYFMAVFDEALEKKIEDPRGNLTCLIKHTTGEVKEMVKNCIQLPPKEGYETAKEMMHKLYGDPHSNCGLSQRDQAVATDQPRRC